MRKRETSLSSPPVLSVVGYSNSGKTRVAAELVAAFSSWGYLVAAIKHCHEGHDLDRPFSDTSKLTNAGAAIVIASSPGRMTTIENTGTDLALDEIVERMRPEVDVVIAEGFKSSSVPKVLVVGEKAIFPTVDNVMAVVSDSNVDVDAPTFGFHEVDKLAVSIKHNYLRMNKAGPAGTKAVNAE